MIKIWMKDGDLNGEKKMLLYDGVLSNKNTILVDTIDECDYIFLDYRDVDNDEFMSTIRKYSYKTIILDYRDNPYQTYDHPCLLYFKRSVVCKMNENLVNYKRDIIPISFSIKLGTEHINTNTYKRDIDISVFFNINDHERYRAAMARYVKVNFDNYNIRVGIIGQRGKIGRNTIQREYYDAMLRSKIVVNMFPDNWEGDWRTWETLSCGALLITENIISPTVNPLIHKETVVFYNRHDMESLGKLIQYYLNNDTERTNIAKAGTSFARQFHKASDRIHEIIKEIELL